MSIKKALIIFVKNPVLGKVKTRLAKSLGDENALLIYQKLLEHTQEITETVEHDKFVFYSDFINENDLWNNDLYNKRLQIGHHLGEKMSHALQALFDQGYQSVVIIGSDAYELQTDDINLAFEELETFDCVLGPAKDGGYYLMGLQSMVPELFEDKLWSTKEVLVETERDLKRLFKTTKKLRTLSDVDFEKDLGELKKYIQYKTTD